MKMKNLLTTLGPGILVAATGVGAGDLATAAFTGTNLGLSVLWAVLVGAFFKYVLNEGLTRWQLATGDTLLEGALRHLGRPAQYIFLLYLLVWSFMVAAALMSACGVTFQSILPVMKDPAQGKIVYGMVFSLTGIVLVRVGGYRLFERVMGTCIGLMVAIVATTVVLLEPNPNEVLSGLLLPTIPQLDGPGLAWTIALMGGVGGTVTVLCYGYWIREQGRFSARDLKVCRVDLAVAYSITALFGVAMVIIGSTVRVEARGATLVIQLADKLGGEVGTVGKWVFLVGAMSAVFSSLLGVWQSVPYLFTDLWKMVRGEGTAQNSEANTYKFYLYGLAIIPMLGLWVGFASMQKFYAVWGALFMPMLALTLLLLNGRTRLIGKRYRNSPIVTVILMIILLFFVWMGGLTVRKVLGW